MTPPVTLTPCPATRDGLYRCGLWTDHDGDHQWTWNHRTP